MMQIKSIILYSNKGGIRQLDFALNKVNLVTGNRYTGKSALISIVDYCLGHSESKIPEGIEKYVSWYAVLYQVGDTQAFIAKPKPKNGNKESEGVYKEGNEINIPTYKDLMKELKTNDYYIKQDLSVLLRKSLGLSYGDEAKNFNLTVDYTNYYLFRPTSATENKEEIFYQQTNDGIKIIKQSLPYFLGAESESDLSAQSEYVQTENKLREIKRTLKQHDENIKTNKENIENFFIKAQSLNLIEKDLLSQTMNIDEKSELLLNIKENSDLLNNISVLKDFEPELRQELEQLQNELKEKSFQLAAIKSYNDDINGYSKEANEHRIRLESIKLFEHKYGQEFIPCDNEDLCPLCNSHLLQDIPKISAIKKSLTHLDKNLKTTDRDKINVEKQYKILETEIKEQEEFVKEKRKNLLDFVKNKKNIDDAFKQLQLEYGDKREFIGEIKQFFKSNKPINGAKIKKLQDDKEVITQNLEKSKSKLDEIKIRANHKKANFNNLLTAFASTIHLSHKGNYLFDWDIVDITVSDRNNFVSMKKMGSLDIPGCHLITLLALHKCFISEKRPVPRFLILDQLIQGYSSENKNDDTDKIKDMIRLILDVCKETELQVILTEHKQNLPYREELHCVESHWTVENALIPNNWIES